MPVSRDAVTWAFRFAYGREPASERAFQTHAAHVDEESLFRAVLTSDEFRRSTRYKDLVRLDVKPGALSPYTAHEQESRLLWLFLGNCQARTLALLTPNLNSDLRAISLELTATTLKGIRDGTVPLAELCKKAHRVFYQPDGDAKLYLDRFGAAAPEKLREFPSLVYSGFHPDQVYIKQPSVGLLGGPTGTYHSSIALLAWKHGLAREETIRLFCDTSYAHLGFARYAAEGVNRLRAQFLRMGLFTEDPFERWNRRAPWMLTLNHPRNLVMADLGRELLLREGLDAEQDIDWLLPEILADEVIWPVYPEIARNFGIPGSYRFKVARSAAPQGRDVAFLDLSTLIDQTFSFYDNFQAHQLVCERIDQPAYQSLIDHVRTRRGHSPPLAMTSTDRRPSTAASVAGPDAAKRHPYQGLPDWQYWRQALALVPVTEVDPVVQSTIKIGREQRVATAGSCFAQHISRTLQRMGFNYYYTELDEQPSPMFSARFGNLYTARQLVQLVDRAYGRLKPIDTAWQRTDGAWVDPFRPQVVAQGLPSAAAVVSSTEAHLQRVRELLEGLDVFVFTLGLTETWRNRADGCVYPVAPGVSGGTFDEREHDFVNFDAESVKADLSLFARQLAMVNPKAQVLLTVSPVPLIATYENRHVLVSTTYSKSALRVAAQAAVEQHANFHYFPSYEIITGHFNRGRYFEADLRSVNPEGVGHVMRLFSQHCVLGEVAQPLGSELDALARVVCDEEAAVKS
jgi:hypothetical protein